MKIYKVLVTNLEEWRDDDAIVYEEYFEDKSDADKYAEDIKNSLLEEHGEFDNKKQMEEFLDCYSIEEYTIKVNPSSKKNKS